jgi:hypothetical protein
VVNRVKGEERMSKKEKVIKGRIRKGEKLKEDL